MNVASYPIHHDLELRKFGIFICVPFEQLWLLKITALTPLTSFASLILISSHYVASPYSRPESLELGLSEKNNSYSTIDLSHMVYL